LRGYTRGSKTREKKGAGSRRSLPHFSAPSHHYGRSSHPNLKGFTVGCAWVVRHIFCQELDEGRDTPKDPGPVVFNYLTR
jgi:hypothetical protein